MKQIAKFLGLVLLTLALVTAAGFLLAVGVEKMNTHEGFVVWIGLLFCVAAAFGCVYTIIQMWVWGYGD